MSKNEMDFGFDLPTGRLSGRFSGTWAIVAAVIIVACFLAAAVIVYLH